MPADPNELVHIKHPQIKTLGGPVTRQALDTIYTEKGWSEASEGDVAKAAAAEANAAFATTTTTEGKK